MDRKMNVLGVQVDDYSAKEAMRQAIEYLQTEGINVIEMLTTDVLVKSSVVEGVKQNTEEADMILTEFFSTPFEGGRHQKRIDKIPVK